MVGVGSSCSGDQVGRRRADDAAGNIAAPLHLDDPLVEVLVEQIGNLLAHSAGGEVSVMSRRSRPSSSWNIRVAPAS
jgi:hypothetical protein